MTMEEMGFGGYGFLILIILFICHTICLFVAILRRRLRSFLVRTLVRNSCVWLPNAHLATCPVRCSGQI